MDWVGFKKLDKSFSNVARGFEEGVLLLGIKLDKSLSVDIDKEVENGIKLL